MAPQPKPGKFEYRLETLLRVRKIKEKKEQEKFAEDQRRFLEEQRRAQLLRDEKVVRTDELKDVLSPGGKISDFGQVLRRRVHLDDLDDRKKKQEETERKAQKKLDVQREVLIEKMKERKIIEKDKGNKYKEHKDLMSHLEGKFLDDVATSRFIRGL